MGTRLVATQAEWHGLTMETETLSRPSTVEINGIAVELLQRGSGPTLLFLHPHIGLAGADRFLHALARKFAVYAPSHPGFGRSALPRDFTTVDDLAYFYLDLIEAARPRPHSIWSASSFGGLARCRDRDQGQPAPRASGADRPARHSPFRARQRRISSISLPPSSRNSIASPIVIRRMPVSTIPRCPRKTPSSISAIANRRRCSGGRLT